MRKIFDELFNWTIFCNDFFRVKSFIKIFWINFEKNFFVYFVYYFQNVKKIWILSASFRLPIFLSDAEIFLLMRTNWIFFQSNFVLQIFSSKKSETGRFRNWNFRTWSKLFSEFSKIFRAFRTPNFSEEWWVFNEPPKKIIR